MASYSIHRRGRKWGVTVYVWREGYGSDCGLNYDLGTFPTKAAAEKAIQDDRSEREEDAA